MTRPVFQPWVVVCIKTAASVCLVDLPGLCLLLGRLFLQLLPLVYHERLISLSLGLCLRLSSGPLPLPLCLRPLPQ